jgi:hypothetical protein
LKHDRIVLNGINGWIGMLRGPAVAPIAVAGIAMCYGLEALPLHPAAASLRQHGPTGRPPSQESEAVGSVGTIVRLPTRRPPVPG